jgi:hypothetical protein
MKRVRGEYLLIQLIFPVKTSIDYMTGRNIPVSPCTAGVRSYPFISRPHPPGPLPIKRVGKEKGIAV